MAGTNTQEIVRRLQRLGRLVDTYGHLLTASELERTLPGLVPIIAAGGTAEAEAGALLKEILQRGPAQLLADLEEMERIARSVKDAEIYVALNRVREAFLHVVRYNAPALLRRLDQSGQTSPTIITLQKEVQAFVQNVARAVTAPPDDFSEIFADEELLGEPAAPAADSGNGVAVSGGGPVVTRAGRPVPVPSASAPQPQESGGVGDESGTPELATEFFPLPWSLEPDVSAEPETAPAAPADGAADAAPIEWMRDRIEVINDMLQRWAVGERLAPDTSALVRRGRLTAEQCRALYQELLEAGAVPIIDRLARVRAANGAEGDAARALRGRIVDGVVGSIPRLLGLLSSGGQLNTEVDGVRGDPDRVLADLADYLARAAELYDAGSPLRERLLYLAGELRAVTNL